MMMEETTIYITSPENTMLNCFTDHTPLVKSCSGGSRAVAVAVAAEADE